MKKANSIFLNILFIILALVAGYYLGKQGYALELRGKEVTVEVKNKMPNYNLNADFTIFWQAFDDLNKKHLEKPLDQQKLVQGAIEGMVSSLDDPYTVYLPPTDNTSSDEILKGEYEGIGAELILKDEYVTIVSPFDDSPAKKADLRPNDRIIEINGESAYGLGLQEAVSKIKGPKGTEVSLKIGREGKEEPFDVKLVRDTIKLETVSYSVNDEKKTSGVKNLGEGVAYMRISRFGEKTNTEWDTAVNDILIKHSNTKSIILDLRGNPGGYLDSAVYIASEFIEKGTVVKEEFSDGTVRNLPVSRKGKFIGKKLIVLVDAGSASASEILAGALRERANATIVGTKSFGKGTVQEPIDYTDGSGINITIGKWLTPEGYWVHKQGIEPDEKIELSEDDIKNNNDKQLQKAVELAK